jgi:hypothetical protein
MVFNERDRSGSILMTKKQEIEAIKLFAERLGPNSYCGPWLKDQLIAIEQAIKDDFEPTCYAMTFVEARKEQAKIISDGKDIIAGLLVDARDKADKLIADAQRKVVKIEDRIRRLTDEFHKFEDTLREITR